MPDQPTRMPEAAQVAQVETHVGVVGTAHGPRVITPTVVTVVSVTDSAPY